MKELASYSLFVSGAALGALVWVTNKFDTYDDNVGFGSGDLILARLRLVCAIVALLDFAIGAFILYSSRNERD